MRIKPKNWSSFQHYKDRSPSWIKLHKRLLDDFEFHCLPLASRALAPMLWLLASESEDGEIECNWKRLAFRLRCEPDEVEYAVKALIEQGFFESDEDASALLAEPERDASLEKRREENINKEREKEESTAIADVSAKPPKQKLTKSDLVSELEIPEDVAEAWLEVRKAKRQALTRVAMQSLINEFGKAGLSVQDGVRLCVERGWVGFKASWDWQDKPSGKPGSSAETPQERGERMARERGYM